MHFYPHQRGIDPGAGTAVDQRQAHVWIPADGCSMVRQAFGTAPSGIAGETAKGIPVKGDPFP
ncbi:hypothetical protein SM139_3610 [Stenotrophomonas maltophilia]|nr:hypothetical protein SM139_3610 [Stenotrophomonas maltophilia]